MTDVKTPHKNTDKYTNGMRTRRQVLGDTHVDTAERKKTDFDTPFQDFITEGAWGTVWADDTLTPRERSMITLALLSALGHHEEVAMHIRASKNTGATPQDIQQVFMQVAVYAGVPCANTAFKIAKSVYAEDDNTI